MPRDYRAYRRHPGAERIRLVDLMPALHERSADARRRCHYFYVNPWAVTPHPVDFAGAPR